MAVDLSLVTVTFWNDFDLLDRQLTSIDEFLTPGYAHNIILNDSIKHLAELNDILSQHTKHNYNVYHCEQIPGFINHKTGWFNQQICKLIVANVIASKYYLILDSKNYVVKSFDPTTWIKDEKITMLKLEPLGDFVEWFKESCRLFDLEVDNNSAMNAVTPFIMKTQYVQDLLSYLQSRDLKLTDVIGNHTDSKFKCVEFYLYNLWLIYTNKIDKEIAWVNSILEIQNSYKGRKNCQ
jgi:hypothetical protein